MSWFKVGERGQPREGDRLHARINGRYVTVFRHGGSLSAIDSICHHAGGPMTMGKIQDIEDLNLTVVLCPWHKFMVTIDRGVKVYQAVEILNGKPVITGWKSGKVVQRPHTVTENSDGVFVMLMLDGEECVSDQDANSELCAQSFPISVETDTPSTIII